MAKFIRCGPEKVARITTFKWVIDKTGSITESRALHLGVNIADSAGPHNDQHLDGAREDNDDEYHSLEGAENDGHRKTARQGRVRFFDDVRNQDVCLFLTIIIIIQMRHCFQIPFANIWFLNKTLNEKWNNFNYFAPCSHDSHNWACTLSTGAIGM
jgi:hypothetical protein